MFPVNGSSVSGIDGLAGLVEPNEIVAGSGLSPLDCFCVLGIEVSEVV